MSAVNAKCNIATIKSVTAVPTTTSAQLLSAASSAAEKNKQWQRELLMERIRSRSSQHKSFAELSKAMRMSMLEKRYALDAVEKANLQKCLDSMQHCIKVTSRQGLVERLESLSRQLGLKFMEDTSGLFISTDMFFLEIILDANGALTDVKVHHECKIEQQSCSELVNCLNRGDFADFTVQLEGLSSIYQLNAEPKVKTKAFVALQAMETDIYNLFQMQNFSKDLQQLVKESAVGLVLKRRGGHPMKLIYFISPYDLISLETKSLQPITTELITSKDIGFNVTINLEASSANKLQILPVVSISKDLQTGLDVPMHTSLTQQNSMLLPATFVLRLNKPLPVCYITLKALGVPLCGASGASSGMESPDKGEDLISPIMNLVVQTASEMQMKNSRKGLFVNLPDQTHCYFFTENKQLQATLVSSIPYTEPIQVPKILDFLKRQALFYSLLASCVRTQSKMGNDMESTTILEVNATSFQQITVSLQHPYEESMATVEFDLHDANVKCIIYSLTHNYDLLSLKLTKIVEKCLSIPVTIRALLKFWDQESISMFQRSIGGGMGGLGGTAAGNGNNAGGYGNFSLVMGPNDSGGGAGARGGGCIKIEPNTRQQQMLNMSNPSATVCSGAGMPGFIKYKADIKMEDFHECPKSQMQNTFGLHAAESSSLGGAHHLQQLQQQQQQHLPQQHDHQAVCKQSEIEIADKYKNIWKDKTPNLKNCVSITPISPDGGSRGAHQQVDVKRTVGIEIIPLTGNSAGNCTGNAVTTTAGQPGVNPSSTITITPINAVGSGNNVAKDKKSTNSAVAGSSGLCAGSIISATSSKRPLDVTPASESQREKKRKKKRDDSPMGPPEKVYSRQNSPAATSETAATVVARKFSSPSSSPKGGSGGIMGNSGSVGSVGGGASATLLSTRPSPKHSPVYSSPKHTNTASNSPKSPFGTHSPKHGSSGKPSMSTLKSAAATSLSPKGDKPGANLAGTATVLSAAAAAGVAAANAVKTAMGVGVTGMQQLKTMNHLGAPTAMNSVDGSYGGVPNISGIGGGGMGVAMSGGGAGSSMNINSAAAAAAQAAAMRKVVTSAVSSTASMISIAPTTATLAAPGMQSVPLRSPPGIGSSEMNASGHIDSWQQNSAEYKVKSSQEGLKMTINKTSNGGNSFGHAGTASGNGDGGGSNTATITKCGKTNGPASAGAPRKQHTGLKPGVHSGPASKKLAASYTLPKKSATSKHPFQKSNSSGSLSAKMCNEGGGGLIKSNSTNSFGALADNSGSSGTGSSRKSSKKSVSSSSGGPSSSASQSAARLDHQADMLKILQYASPTMAANMEGFMKGLNSKFQIPKLSQRAAVTATTIANGSLTSSYSAPTTPTVLSPSVSPIGSVLGTKRNNLCNETLQKQLSKSFTNSQSSSPLHEYHSNAAVTVPHASTSPTILQQGDSSMHMSQSAAVLQQNQQHLHMQHTAQQFSYYSISQQHHQQLQNINAQVGASVDYNSIGNTKLAASAANTSAFDEAVFSTDAAATTPSGHIGK